MATLDERQFRQALQPTLQKMREDRQTLVEFARSVKEKPRPLSAGELLMLLVNECQLMYSRRERNYE